MKLLMTALMIFGSSFVLAETIQLPGAAVNQEILGGDILLIKMKAHLIISGKESQALEKELGAETKKKLTHDMVMTKSFEELKSSYNPSNDKPMVQVILNRYAEVLAKIDAKLTLN